MPRYINRRFSGKFLKNCHRNDEKVGVLLAAKYLRLICDIFSGKKTIPYIAAISCIPGELATAMWHTINPSV